MPFLKEDISKKAAELGFDLCGFARAGEISPEGERFEMRVAEEGYKNLSYLFRNIPGRRDPRTILPTAQTVIVLMMNYYHESLPAEGNFIISRYAYVKDYHLVIKKRLKELVRYLKISCGSKESVAYVDSGPVLEKGWASRSGLGWQGKHTILINRNRGSFFFIGTIITDLEIDPDIPETDHCGNCTRCIDACPTGALSPYKLDPGLCISNLTIEDNINIPAGLEDKFGGRIYGCDICQEACPYNRFSVPATDPELQVHSWLKEMNREKWMAMTEEEFMEKFAESAVIRTGYKRLMHNIQKVSGQPPQE